MTAAMTQYLSPWLLLVIPTLASERETFLKVSQGCWFGKVVWMPTFPELLTFNMALAVIAINSNRREKGILFFILLLFYVIIHIFLDFVDKDRENVPLIQVFFISNILYIIC